MLCLGARFTSESYRVLPTATVTLLSRHCYEVDPWSGQVEVGVTDRGAVRRAPARMSPARGTGMYRWIPSGSEWILGSPGVPGVPLGLGFWAVP